MIKLDIGCGDNKCGFDWIGLDIVKTPSTDIICDIERGIPFLDNSVDAICCNYFLEHIGDIVFVINEIYRVCKNGAKIYMCVPHFSACHAHHELHHRSFMWGLFHDLDTENKNQFKEQRGL